jgi:hypothetical protein
MSYEERSSRKESGIIWLLAGLWKMQRVKRNIDKGKCPLCLGKEDITHIILDCLETRIWRKEF